MSARKQRRSPPTRLLWCIGGVIALSSCAAPGQTGVAASGSVDPIAVGSTTPTSQVATSAGGTVAPSLPSCTSGGLATVTPGVLTVATGQAPTSPWYVEQLPANGAGLEAALAYQIAQVLGYDHDHVVWTTVDRTQAAAGTASGFDFDLDQFTAPDTGTKTADYSTGYFSVSDTLLMRRGVPAPASAAALAGMPLGAVAGSSGSTAVQRVAGTNPQSFPDEKQAVTALTAGSVSGVVVSTPTALALAASNPDLILVGQLPDDPSAQPDQLKALLPEGSALTGCVSSAVDRLRVEGSLDALAKQWVDAVAPELS